MFDMMKMMGQIKKAQDTMKKAQEGLKEITETSESGAGLVKATVNGKKEIISIDINESILNVKEKEITQDLIVAAINKALGDIDVKSKEHIKNKTKDIIPNIPGFDLGNMFK